MACSWHGTTGSLIHTKQQKGDGDVLEEIGRWDHPGALELPSINSKLGRMAKETNIL